jgi:hypothetical protein
MSSTMWASSATVCKPALSGAPSGSLPYRSSSQPILNTVHPPGCQCDSCQFDGIATVQSVTPSSSALSAPKAMLRRSLLSRKSGGGTRSYLGLKPIKVKHFSNLLSSTSSSASSLSVNSALVFNASNFPELNSFAALYDEVRVNHITLHHMPWILTPASAGASFSTGALSIEFDPSISGPSSVSSTIESSHTTGPFFLSGGAALGNGLQPSYSKYHKLQAKMPAPMAPVVASDCVGSAWFTVDVTPPTVAVLNGFFTALGTTGVIEVEYLWELDCEYKMRT